MSSTRDRLVKLLQRDIPEYRGRKIVWKPEALYPCRGFWRIRRTEMDVQSWQATAFLADAPDRPWLTTGCWETMTECLKAGAVEYAEETQTIFAKEKE